ncbi:hypothetical protein [Dyadobacter jiangsuensis]|uniref:YD repeat-containing protein n=1 Tax=Dyadobacter jiangsuensis TaxID=1591085 RepID=A0A2P8GFT7_9BACT|nr:hypothetical protein [Dyadobacter jiangsuensis]PSL32846.1 hypothetical protein CLV60_102565 [Dyadobacter jiangsuensis]
MKKLHIPGNLLKVLLLGTLLTGCQNDDLLSPQETIGVTADDQNAKINAELKLVKDGTTIVQYVKQGRFTGKLSKVSETAYYTQYSYDDSTGDLWVTSKRYNKNTNALVEEIKYKIVNGRCITSINVSTNWTSQFVYNEVGRLNEINLSSGALTQKRVFTYDYNSATGTERLKQVVFSTPTGAYQQVNFTYTYGLIAEKKDKYHLNSEHLGLDRYLPYFTKFSDVLIQQVQITPLPYTNQAKPYYRYFYSLNADGYAIGRNKEFFPLGYGYEAGKQSFYSGLDYSTNWGGI